MCVSRLCRCKCNLPTFRYAREYIHTFRRHKSTEIQSPVLDRFLLHCSVLFLSSTHFRHLTCPFLKLTCSTLSTTFKNCQNVNESQYFISGLTIDSPVQPQYMYCTVVIAITELSLLFLVNLI